MIKNQMLFYSLCISSVLYTSLTTASLPQRGLPLPPSEAFRDIPEESAANALIQNMRKNPTLFKTPEEAQRRIDRTLKAFISNPTLTNKDSMRYFFIQHASDIVINKIHLDGRPADRHGKISPSRWSKCSDFAGIVAEAANNFLKQQ